MSGVLAQLPEVSDQESFNLQRWSELEVDPFLASLDCRIETDQFGQIIMMPPSEGRVRLECPAFPARIEL